MIYEANDYKHSVELFFTNTHIHTAQRKFWALSEHYKNTFRCTFANFIPVEKTQQETSQKIKS